MTDNGPECICLWTGSVKLHIYHEQLTVNASHIQNYNYLGNLADLQAEDLNEFRRGHNLYDTVFSFMCKLAMLSLMRVT